MSNMMQRWWLEPKYESVLRDPEGLAWELRGASVKCLTEEEFLAAGGGRQHTGKPNARRRMGRQHDGALRGVGGGGADLRRAAELHGVGDCGGAGGAENLPEKAGCSLPNLLDPEPLRLLEFPMPKAVDSKTSMLKKGRTWVISASGGVTLHPWGEVEKRAERRAVGGAGEDGACQSGQVVVELRPVGCVKRTTEPRRVLSRVGCVKRTT